MTQVNFEIGQTVKNTITNKIEKVKNIGGGYINGYRADLWVLVADTKCDTINNLTDSLLNSICLRQTRWNKKFYGNGQRYIFIDNVKYFVTYNQIEELSRHFEVDF